MNNKSVLVVIVLFIFCNAVIAAETTEIDPVKAEAESKAKHEDLKRVIKDRTQNMKQDAKVIKEAISKDFDGSTEELQAEYKKIEKRFEEFSKEITKQQKWLSQEKSKLSKKFKERQEDLEEMIKTIVEE